MIVALLLGAVPTPLAGAVGAVTAAFTGTATTNHGFWAPCATVDAGHACPPQVILTPPPVGKMAPPFTPYGDLGLATFTASTCADPGACSLTLGFSMNGYCGLATGRGTGGLLGSTGVPHQLAFTYTVTGATLVARGAATNLSTGEVGDILLTGTFVAADPDDCLDGTATSFTFVGDLTLAYPKLTP